ncbi:spore germination protein [Bacillus sp. 2205SS5-2]|uniref:spore germination protein n=1 Tax=Bacillus sp. 2205SS5-2 TaxID=3109031 RepID=UPI003003D4E4
MGLLQKFKNTILKNSQEAENEQLRSTEPRKEENPLDFNHIVHQFIDCMDFKHRIFKQVNAEIIYIDHLVDSVALKEELVDWLNKGNKEALQQHLESSQFIKRETNKEVVVDVLSGSVAISYLHEIYSLNIKGIEKRSIEESETESVILGPHEAFIESLDINISLIRKRVKSSHLKTVSLKVGEISKTDVTLMYIEDIVSEEDLHYLKNRIENIEYTGVIDSNMLVQFIDDHPFSPFPQFFTTERPDVVSSKLVAGKIIGLVEGSPHAFCAPVSFFDFLQSVDDYSERWIVGSFIRLLRLFALAVTVFFTAIYVSVTTFHYEMIPEQLLPSLIESRSKVPFPPLIEAIFLELVIELLREAGARLPTKIGQTIGIVGGIVIGQAVVEAGITSNILIIVVAASAISSFVIPSYTMSASIRIVRFSFILLAGFWGNMGLIFGLGVLIIHLSKMTSLNTPYLIPISPTYFGDWRDTLIRAPYKFIKERPAQVKTTNKIINKMKK